MGTVQYRQTPIATAAKLGVATAFVVLAGLGGADGRAELSDGGVRVAADAKAEAAIIGRIELRQYGGLLNDSREASRTIQTTVKPCDAEAAKLRPGCVLMVYEVQ